MLTEIYNNKKYNKGFTLIELIIVVPLISIIFLITYNIIFVSNKSFFSTKDKFSTYEDIRKFEINIQKEANQARKATKNQDVMEKISGKELHIYTDVNGDNIPEIVRYRIVNKELIRDVKYPILKANSNEFPYVYNSSWSDEKIVLKNVKDIDFIEDIENIRKQDNNIITKDIKDYRKKATLKFSINDDSKTGKIDLTIVLVTKSRAEAY
ncbi:prepilin-type N-terminal cleavage/methylation domain-containing protein [Tissierella sp.]|uniref:prepilin-type N-terminal cleavage/methylation domain-containing protein n=1 Tax=Tissierella sp. TaxID=41274 RepID=UPI0028B0AE81|nr:prepilin-type N-terminal cleavage/methylation domain-containing protein [Tissierella sp.]